MQDRYLKEIAIVLSVIVIIVLCGRAFHLYNVVSAVPPESIHSQSGLSQNLTDQIAQINTSIAERKSFVFDVRRDPLKQDLIVQSRLDLLAEWQATVRRTLRVASIVIDGAGNRKAIFAYDGAIHTLTIGDTIAGRRIVDITADRVHFIQDGNRTSLTIQPIPPMPEELRALQSSSGRL